MACAGETRMAAPATAPRIESNARTAKRMAAEGLSSAAWQRFLQRVQNAPLLRRFVYGACWSGLATFSARFLVLLSTIYVARTLGREPMGQFGAVQTTIGLFGVFAGCGLGVATTRFVAELRHTDPLRTGRIILSSLGIAALLGGFCAVLCWCLSGWLAWNVLAAPELTEPLQVGSVLILCHTVQGVQAAALTGFEAFRANSLLQIIGGVGTFCGVIIGVQWGGVTGAVAALSTVSAFQAVLGQLVLQTVIRAEAIPVLSGESWSETFKLLRFSLPLALSSLTVLPTEWLVTACLVNQPEGYGQLGLYSAACQWFNALLLIPMVVGQAALPVLSERWGRGDKRGFQRLMFLAMLTNVGLIFPLVAAGWLISDWLMTRNGTAFGEGAGVLCVLLSATLVVAVQTPVGNSLQAAGRTGVSLSMNLAWATTYFLLATLWISAGAWGVAWARLVAYGVHTVWVLAYVWLQMRTWPADRKDENEGTGRCLDGIPTT